MFAIRNKYVFIMFWPKVQPPICSNVGVRTSTGRSVRLEGRSTPKHSTPPNAPNAPNAPGLYRWSRCWFYCMHTLLGAPGLATRNKKLILNLKLDVGSASGSGRRLGFWHGLRYSRTTYWRSFRHHSWFKQRWPPWQKINQNMPSKKHIYKWNGVMFQAASICENCSLPMPGKTLMKRNIPNKTMCCWMW